MIDTILKLVQDILDKFQQSDASGIIALFRDAVASLLGKGE